MIKVAVLMSVYNGEKYLKEQIDSILAQQDVELDLYIRDDGSSDGSTNIVKDYEKKCGNVKLLEGQNIGVGNSFMELLYQAPPCYDFYSFADQDDIWQSNKLSRAGNRIGSIETPCLYTSNQMLVDEDGKILRLRYEEEPNTCIEQILCCNRLAGCTMVFNKQLYRLLIEEKRRPTKELLHNRIHDVWVAMVAQVTGEIVYDSESYIYYRQHANNVVGGLSPNIRKRIKERIDKIKQRSLRCGRSWLAMEIYQKYGDMDFLKKQQIMKYVFYKKSLKSTINLAIDFSLIRYSGEYPWAYFLKVMMHLF